MKNISAITKPCQAAFQLTKQRGRLAQGGFTLIEVMITVVIVSVLASIAIPSYVTYARRSSAAQAQQEMQRLAEQLERWKSKNFSYKGFDPAYIYGVTAPLNSVVVPFGTTGIATKYTITIRDLSDSTKLLTDSAATGQGWAIQAVVNNDPKNYNLLIASDGTRCKNTATISYTSCNTGSEGW